MVTWNLPLLGKHSFPSTRFVTENILRLIVANEMLSLLGSIQPDPFSPEHVPESGKRQQIESDAEDSELHRAPDPQEDDEDDDSEIETDEDTFKALGHRTDEIATAEAYSRREAETQALAKENKRGRKAEKAEGKKRKRMTSRS